MRHLLARALAVPLAALLTFAALSAGLTACGRPDSVGPVMATTSVEGTATAADLREWQRRWTSLGLADYDFDLGVTCFCPPEYTRPVTVHVRGGLVERVTPREAGAVRPPSDYPTIDTLFARALAERAGGGHVSGTFDREFGYPTQIEIGTIANDAGIVYVVSALRRVR